MNIIRKRSKVDYTEINNCKRELWIYLSSFVFWGKSKGNRMIEGRETIRENRSLEDKLSILLGNWMANMDKVNELIY